MAWVIWARYPVLALILVARQQAALFIKGDVTWRFFNAPEISRSPAISPWRRGHARRHAGDDARDAARRGCRGREYEERMG
jgi:hypothetical protein